MDRANFYTGGSSERFVGEFIVPHREEVVLATKYSNAVPGKDANAGGNQRKNMVQAVEASLKRLGTDYIVSAVPMGFPHDLLNGVVRGSLSGGMRDRIIARIPKPQTIHL